MESQAVYWASLLTIAILCICGIVEHQLGKRKLLWWPVGSATMIIGMAMGLLEFTGSGLHDSISFNHKIFHLFLLPPIIFDAGFAMKKRGMFSNLGTILIFAFIGTFISCISVGFSAYGYLGSKEGGYSTYLAYECLMLGSALGATDPVASLAIFSSVWADDDDSHDIKKKKDSPLLYNLIFGESVFNDAIAIIFFVSFEDFLDSPFEGAKSVFGVLGEFLLILVVSTLIGVVFACVCSLIYKHCGITGNLSLEIIIMLLMSYSAYLLAEAIHMSGIISIFFCGIVNSHYTFWNMCEEARHVVPQIFHSLAFVAEIFIFAYLGMTTFSFQSSHEWDIGFIIMLFFVMLAARIFQTFLLSAVANLGRKHKINWKQQIVLCFAGLRGAVAFSLIMGMATNHTNLFITTTLILVFFTTFIFGCLTYPLLKLLGLDKEPPKVLKLAKKSRQFHSFDHRYFKPFFCVPSAVKRVYDSSGIALESMPENGTADFNDVDVKFDQVEVVDVSSSCILNSYSAADSSRGSLFGHSAFRSKTVI